ncbi:hypothetical protein BASA62_001407 [Batrachochytrium salamandrivorans]|nr:hypothetical protein BASA62_001407 [Batrachochytrium salamandrivorans]
MTKVKAFELRSKDKTQLTAQLSDLKQELASLRVQKVSNGNAPKLAKMQEVSPSGSSLKKTRAIRRRLTPHEASRKTLRQIKKETHFPLRKYAVKA